MSSTGQPGIYAPEQFAAMIKSQYPQYKDWPDDHLVREITNQYPQYKSWVAGSVPDPRYNVNIGESGYRDLATGKVQREGQDSNQSQLGAGVFKTGVDTVAGLIDVIQKLLPSYTGQPQKPLVNTQPAHEFAQPATGYEKAGKIVGDAAEFLLPGGAATKAGEVAKAAGMGRKGYRAVRAGVDALGSGILSQANSPEHSAADFALGAGGSLAGRAAGVGAGKVAGKLLSKPQAEEELVKTAGKVRAGVEGNTAKVSNAGALNVVKQAIDEETRAGGKSTRYYELKALRDAMNPKLAGKKVVGKPAMPGGYEMQNLETMKDRVTDIYKNSKDYRVREVGKQMIDELDAAGEKTSTSYYGAEKTKAQRLAEISHSFGKDEMLSALGRHMIYHGGAPLAGAAVGGYGTHDWKGALAGALAGTAVTSPQTWKVMSEVAPYAGRSAPSLGKQLADELFTTGAPEQ